MDNSIVFARWSQCALPWGHNGATWRIGLNLCFLWNTRAHNPNSKSIGSAIFAQLTVENPHTLQRGTDPHFSAHVYGGQTTGWIKTPLGTKVGFGPDHIVLHADPAPPEGHSPPQLSLSVVKILNVWKCTMANGLHVKTVKLLCLGNSSIDLHVYCGQMVAHLSCCWALDKNGGNPPSRVLKNLIFKLWVQFRGSVWVIVQKFVAFSQNVAICRIQRVKMDNHAKFHEDRLNCCPDTAI